MLTRSTERRPGAGLRGLSTLFNVLAVAAVGCLLVLVALIVGISLRTRQLERRLERAQDALSRPLVLPRAVATAYADLSHTRGLLDRLEEDYAGLTAQHAAWGAALAAVFQQAATELSLSQVGAEGLTARVVGHATSADLVAAYAGRLRASGLFSRVTVESIAGSSSEPSGTPAAQSIPAAPAADGNADRHCAAL